MLRVGEARHSPLALGASWRAMEEDWATVEDMLVSLQISPCWEARELVREACEEVGCADAKVVGRVCPEGDVRQLAASLERLAQAVELEGEGARSVFREALLRGVGRGFVRRSRELLRAPVCGADYSPSLLGRVVWMWALQGDWAVRVALFGDDPVAGVLLGTGSYEQELTVLHTSLLEKGAFVLDVGAHVGTKTLAYAQQVGHGGGRVVAVEAQRPLLVLLRAGVRAAGLTDVVRTVHAVVRAAGEAEEQLIPGMRYGAEGGGEWNWGATSFAAGARVTEFMGDWRASGGARCEPPVVDRVPAVTIDAIVAREGGRCPAFVKLDVEGMEDRVLRGATDTLRRCRPLVDLEAHHLESTRNAFLLLAADLRYALFAVPFWASHAERLVDDARPAQDAVTNALAVPRECADAGPQCPPALAARLAPLLAPSAPCPLRRLRDDDLREWHAPPSGPRAPPDSPRGLCGATGPPDGLLRHLVRGGPPATALQRRFVA